MSSTLKRTGSFLLIFIITIVLAELSLRVAGYIYKNSRTKAYNVPGKINILCIGESTTHFGGEDSYPAILQKILNQKHPGKFHVINGGVSGAYTDYFRRVIDDTLNTFKPDLTIMMMGINDNFEFYNRLSKKPWSDNILNNFYLYRFFKNTKEFNSFIGEDLNYFTYTRYINSIVEKLPKTDIPKLEELEEEIYLKNYDYIGKYLDKNLNLIPKNLALGLSIILLLEKDEKNRILELINSSQNVVSSSRDLTLISHHLLLRPKQNLKFHKEIVNTLYKNSSDKEKFLTSYRRALMEIKRLEYKVTTRVKNIYQKFPERINQGQTVEEVYRNIDQIILSYKDKEQINKHALYNLKETRENIRFIIDKVKAHESKLIFMQYPMRGLEKAKKYFKADLFVENKVNFHEALKMNSFEEIFTDSFAHDFGHTSRLGSSIIAQKVAPGVLELFQHTL